MKTQTVFLLLFIILIASCKTKDSVRKSVSADLPYIVYLEEGIGNIESVPISSVGKEMEYIPLATDTTCLLSRVSSVDFCDSLIFVSDGSRLLCFDRTGKYLYPVGSVGRGPDEYNYVRNFFTDRINKEIYILAMGKVMVFGFDGKLKRTFKADFRPAQVITKDQNTLMFHLFNLSGPTPDTAYSWYVTDKQGVIINRILNHHKRLSRPGLLVPDSPLYLHGSLAHFLEFGNDTLYYYNESVMKPYAIFNPGKLKMETDLELTPETIKEISERIKGTFWIRDITESDDFLFINLAWGLSDSTSFCIYDKNNSKFTVLKDNGFADDINGGPVFWPKSICDDNTLVDNVDAFTLLKYIKAGQAGSSGEKGRKTSTRFEELGKRIDENSNPVLIVLR
jgi:hypothetical protein